MTAIDVRPDPDAEATAAAVAAALRTVDANIADVRRPVPRRHDRAGTATRCGRRGGLPEGANVGWTTSFWPGMLWLAYDLTGDETLPAGRAVARGQLRRARRPAASTWTPTTSASSTPSSCVAAWRRTGDERPATPRSPPPTT